MDLWIQQQTLQVVDEITKQKERDEPIGIQSTLMNLPLQTLYDLKRDYQKNIFLFVLGEHLNGSKNLGFDPIRKINELTFKINSDEFEKFDKDLFKEYLYRVVYLHQQFNQSLKEMKQFVKNEKSINNMEHDKDDIKRICDPYVEFEERDNEVVMKFKKPFKIDFTFFQIHTTLVLKDLTDELLKDDLSCGSEDIEWKTDYEFNEETDQELLGFMGQLIIGWLEYVVQSDNNTFEMGVS